MKNILIVVGIIVVLVGLLGGSINNIPTYDEDAKAKWSDVLNQYKRRADLVPNLVETVKGSAKFEQDTLTAVINARKQVTQLNVNENMLSDPEAFKKFEQAQSGLSSALSRLMVVVEKYPDLKANQNYLALQSQLEGTENRISVARRDYIESVRKYNTELRTFPGRIWAAILYSDMKQKENFSTPESAQETPQVKF